MTVTEAFKLLNPGNHQTLMVRKGFGKNQADSYQAVLNKNVKIYKASGWEVCKEPAPVPAGAKKVEGNQKSAKRVSRKAKANEEV